jgi:hypothetical protein
LKRPVFVGLQSRQQHTGRTFQVNRKIRRQLKRRHRRIARRLEAAEGGQWPRGEGPEFSSRGLVYEIAERNDAIPYGGIGVMLRLAEVVGLVEMLNTHLDVLHRPRPYRDSDHILNIAFNVLCGGRVLDDIELRRNDLVFLNALGARSIPDPTTAGDYCRRFDTESICRLQQILNEVRLRVWNHQPAAFFEQTARIDADGSLVPTDGECKQGMDVSYKGVWGYHPLVVSLANTGEPLWIFNRSGNRPSSEGAEVLFDESIELCRRAGFKDILLRGDTDFSLTKHLDRWDEQGVRFVFGYDAHKSFVERAEGIEESDYSELMRHADKVFEGQPRKKQPRVKDRIIRDRGFLNQTTWAEDLAQFDYKPVKATKTYRIVVLRKTILEDKGQQCLGTRDRYFFYITNDRAMSPQQVVRESNDRCNQERLIEQLKGGVRALHAPLNTLHANWAYMVIAALAWSLKAWFALMLPVLPRWRDTHLAQRDRVLRMEFRTFVQHFMLIPAQILRSGRRLIFRLLAWRPQLHVFFRLVEALDTG